MKVLAVVGTRPEVIKMAPVLTALAGVIAVARTNGVTPATTGIMRELQVVTLEPRAAEG